MRITKKEKKLLVREDFQMRPDEAIETLRAIRNGEVDALVVSTPEGDQVYTLKGAEQVYRLILETLNEGVLTVTPEGHILYCNSRFAEMLKTPLEKVIGSSIYTYLATADQSAFRTILQQSRGKKSRGELSLRTGEESFLPAQVSTNPLKLDGASVFCLTAVDLTRQKRVEEVLRHSTQELEVSNKELQQFAFVASHDLQEPLRKIQTFGSRLFSKFGNRLDDMGRDYLQRMQNAAQRMQELIKALLDLSRVTTKTNPFVPIDLNRLVRKVTEDMEVGIEKTGATVETGDLPVLYGDPNQMRQLFQNLIDNALKFRRAEPPVIRINGKPFLPDRFQITVEDNGIGFKAEYADLIFAPFQRLHTLEEYEGGGMGLSICRRIVERHGGTITAASIPGKGSTFTITLPLKPPEKGRIDEGDSLSLNRRIERVS